MYLLVVSCGLLRTWQLRLLVSLISVSHCLLAAEVLLTAVIKVVVSQLAHLVRGPAKGLSCLR